MVVKLEIGVWPIGTKGCRLQYQNAQKRWRVGEPGCHPTPSYDTTGDAAMSDVQEDGKQWLLPPGPINPTPGAVGRAQ